MRIRQFTPFLAALTLACGGYEEQGALSEAPADAAIADTDAAEIAAVAAAVDYWETHYNMGHASMVADRSTENGLMWSGNGTRVFGREAVSRALAAQMEAASPQISIQQDEALIFGDHAAARGTYTVTGSAEGQEFTNTGYWYSLMQKVDGVWLSQGLVSNLDSPDQMVAPGEVMDMPETPESAAALAERSEYYMTHFNLGHPDMVADTYTEDAVTMAAGQTMIQGREATLARLTEMTDAGAQVTVTPWATQDLDDGAWLAGVGTYEVAIPDQETQRGHFHALYKNVDGELKVHWLLTGAWPTM